MRARCVGRIHAKIVDYQDQSRAPQVCIMVVEGKSVALISIQYKSRRQALLKGGCIWAVLSLKLLMW